MTRLETALAQLGETEHEVLAEIAERLVMGRKQYGPIDPHDDARDWRKEALEEDLDATVYRACALIRARGRA